MSVDVVDDEVRAVRAALSLLVGGALPLPLVEVAEAHGLTAGGWVFPDVPALDLPILNDPAQLIPRGRRVLSLADECGVRVLVPGDPGWPSDAGLDELPCLWVAGDEVDVAALLRQSVTITGSRACSAYGQTVARDLAYALASLGWTVVAAAGFGIDMQAAKSAAAAGGQVVLVSAAGTLPEDHMLTVQDFIASSSRHGAVISALPAGTLMSRRRWAVQQQMLAVMSAATVVVEASATSRALEVARIAAGHGRPVCAVPGPVGSVQSAGCHDLIARGVARLVATSRDVTAAINGRNDTCVAVAGTQVFKVSGTAVWYEQGEVLRVQPVPPLLVSADSPRRAADADSPRRAADAVFDVLFLTRPHYGQNTFDAVVRGPDSAIHTVQVNSSS
jgi:DNA processing protein